MVFKKKDKPDKQNEQLKTTSERKLTWHAEISTTIEEDTS